MEAWKVFRTLLCSWRTLTRFVAKELHKLPSVTFDNVDIRPLKDSTYLPKDDFQITPYVIIDTPYSDDTIRVLVALKSNASMVCRSHETSNEKCSSCGTKCIHRQFRVEPCLNGNINSQVPVPGVTPSIHKAERGRFLRWRRGGKKEEAVH